MNKPKLHLHSHHVDNDDDDDDDKYKYKVGILKILGSIRLWRREKEIEEGGLD